MTQALADRLTLSEAIEIVGRIVQLFPNGGQSAGKGYIGGLAAILADYPRSIAIDAGHPLRGVAATTKFLPTPVDLIAWCEENTNGLRQSAEREAELKQVFRLREECPLPPLRAAATKSALLQRYGLKDIPPNWDAVDVAQAAAKYGPSLRAEIDKIIVQTAHLPAPKSLFGRVVENAEKAMTRRLNDEEIYSHYRNPAEPESAE